MSSYVATSLLSLLLFGAFLDLFIRKYHLNMARGKRKFEKVNFSNHMDSRLYPTEALGKESLHRFNFLTSTDLSYTVRKSSSSSI